MVMLLLRGILVLSFLQTPWLASGYTKRAMNIQIRKFVPTSTGIIPSKVCCLFEPPS